VVDLPGGDSAVQVPRLLDLLATLLKGASG